MKAIPKTDYQRCFADWKKRWLKCIAANGDFFEGNNLNLLLANESCDPQLAIIVDTDMDLTCICQGFHRSLGTLSLVPLRPFSSGVKSGFVVVSSIGTSSSSREVLALTRRWNPGASL
ncbi:hypothetical protein LAZ67_X003679 [Cordylochernes scorpioides]|uniref:Uncharacterized protein n=1 Tax=Cordylochernes scorpioides TaxID=51811 RepID=A0ABY6LUL8_9ARAC|nr:hypothetical protein LAZ67_X003679 [Cordylochernes scorpioides]